MLRDRRIQSLLGAMGALTGLVWAALLLAATLWQVALCGGGSLPRAALPWDTGHAGVLLVSWTMMSAAMMLAAATPWILGVVWRRREVTVAHALGLVLKRMVVPGGIAAVAAISEWAMGSGGLLAEPWLRAGLVVASGGLMLSGWRGVLVRQGDGHVAVPGLVAHDNDSVAMCAAMACLQLGAGMNLAAMAVLSLGLVALSLLLEPGPGSATFTRPA